MTVSPPEALIGRLATDAETSSIRREGPLAFWYVHASTRGAPNGLALLAPRGHRALGDFSGETGDAGDAHVLLRAPVTAENARALRTHLPNLRPVPLGLGTSAGFGDRLGIATPGHARAMRAAGASGQIGPIFAQQSIREMTRTGRTPQQVMDDATWGAFAAGWTHPVGADADHLKTPEDAVACARAGYTMFTIDPGDRVDDSAAEATGADLERRVDALPWEELETTRADLFRRHEAEPVVADGLELRLEGEALARAAAKYGAALAHAARMHRVIAEQGVPFEIEISVDETDSPTTLEEHAFIALELQRLGVPVVSLAPRFVGRFEKGVDFRGDLAELQRTLEGHGRIARALGPYKLSLHSGSDKFSVYPLIVRATAGLVHLKTAGTSYLEALRVAAVHEPELFREVLELARERFETDRASYLIGATLAAVPEGAGLDDGELPGMLDDDDARQVLHVTFGSVLDAFRPRLLELLAREREAHEGMLERHFVRHLRPFAGA